MNAQVNEERLMAYVDGELDANERAAVEAAIAADPALAQRVREQQALRDRIRLAYSAVLAEPVPEHLVAAARGEAGAKVVDLASARAARQPVVEVPRRWHWPEWGAMAASIMLGIVAGALLFGSNEPFTADGNGALIARGGLAQALTNQLASAPPPDAQVQIGLSFVATSGAYCRSFVLDQAAPLAGLACRDGLDWRVQLVAPAAKQEGVGAYRMAAVGLPPTLLKTIDDTIQGQPLDAAAEKAALDRGWRR